jgi:hypothetical protein
VMCSSRFNARTVRPLVGSESIISSKDLDMVI